MSIGAIHVDVCSIAPNQIQLRLRRVNSIIAEDNMTDKKRPTTRMKYVNVDVMPEWYVEDHALLKDMNEKITIHHAQSKIIEDKVEEHEVILRGEDRQDGLLEKVSQLGTTQKIVFAILAAIGASSLSLGVWLVQNALSVAAALAKIH